MKQFVKLFAGLVRVRRVLRDGIENLIDDARRLGGSQWLLVDRTMRPISWPRT